MGALMVLKGCCRARSQLMRRYRTQQAKVTQWLAQLNSDHLAMV